MSKSMDKERRELKHDLIRLMIFVKVFGLPIYGKNFSNTCTGRYNMYDYFHRKYHWSENKINKLCGILSANGIFHRNKSDEGNLYYMYNFVAVKEYAKFLHYYLPIH